MARRRVELAQASHRCCQRIAGERAGFFRHRLILQYRTVATNGFLPVTSFAVQITHLREARNRAVLLPGLEPDLYDGKELFKRGPIMPPLGKQNDAPV